MGNFQSVYIYIPSIVISLVLSYYIFVNDKKDAKNRTFSVITLLSGFWLLTLFFSDYSHSDAQALFWSQVAIIPPAFVPPLVYYFSTIFPKKTESLSRTLKTLVFLPPIIFSITAFSHYNVEAIRRHDWGIEVIPGPIYIVLSFYFFAMITAGVYRFIKHYRFYKEEKLRSQIAYVTTGIFIMLSINIVTSAVLVVLGNSRYSAVGTSSMLVFLGLTVYAMVEKKLFSIKMLLINVAISIVIIATLINTITDVVSSISYTKSIIKIITLMAIIYGGFLIYRLSQEEIERRKEVQKLANDLERANNHLQELDAMKDNFMSMASHELNTPIAAIRGYLSMILEEGMGGGEIPEKARKYLDIVNTSSKRLAALVNDLLNVSRIESGRIHLIYEEVQIEDLIGQAISEVGSKVKEVNHSLNYEKLPLALPKTWVDKTRITEVLINLLGNAIKYTDSGGRITIRNKVSDSFLEVSVQDTGRGIPKNRYDKVFQKFSQVDVLKDQVKGTGLGMYISKNLIELHKGKIWFESEGEGKGSTFYFTLPIFKDKPKDEHEGEGAVLQLK